MQDKIFATISSACIFAAVGCTTSNEGEECPVAVNNVDATIVALKSPVLLDSRIFRDAFEEEPTARTTTFALRLDAILSADLSESSETRSRGGRSGDASCAPTSTEISLQQSIVNFSVTSNKSISENYPAQSELNDLFFFTPSSSDDVQIQEIEAYGLTTSTEIIGTRAPAYIYLWPKANVDWPLEAIYSFTVFTNDDDIFGARTNPISFYP